MRDRKGRKERKRTVTFQDTEDLVPCDEAHLGDTMRITKGNTNLRGCEALPGELDDLLDDFIWGRLGPRRWCSPIWKSGRRFGAESNDVRTAGRDPRTNTLARSMHATHFDSVPLSLRCNLRSQKDDVQLLLDIRERMDVLPRLTTFFGCRRDRVTCDPGAGYCDALRLYSCKLYFLTKPHRQIAVSKTQPTVGQQAFPLVLFGCEEADIKEKGEPNDLPKCCSERSTV